MKGNCRRRLNKGKPADESVPREPSGAPRHKYRRRRWPGYLPQQLPTKLVFR